jgi:hypothetical protein
MTYFLFPIFGGWQISVETLLYRGVYTVQREYGTPFLSHINRFTLSPPKTHPPPFQCLSADYLQLHSDSFVNFLRLRACIRIGLYLPLWSTAYDGGPKMKFLYISLTKDSSLFPCYHSLSTADY